MMNQSTKLYIYGVIGFGALALGVSFVQLQVANAPLFALLFLLATIGGALKMRVPGVDGNLSLGFVPMILAAVLISLPETVIISIAGTLVQALAFSKKRKPLQIAFNCSALALSSIAGALLGSMVANQHIPLVQLALTAVGFYIVNSVLIATVIGMVANRPLLEIWNECLQLYLPYFASGVACAMVALTGTTPEERRSLQYPGIALLPMMLLVRQYFKSALRLPLNH
jgi:hypothetical protein